MTKDKTIKGSTLVALTVAIAAAVTTAGIVALRRKPQVVYVGCPDYVPMTETVRKAAC